MSPKTKSIIKTIRTEQYTDSRTGTVSNNTVKQTLKILKDLDYVRMEMNGVYHINPSLIVKGKSKKRQILMVQYNNIKTNNAA